MTNAVKIYHNPRCSKSRLTLALLEQKGIEPEVILYLKNPPNSAEIKKILKALDISARELMRANESEFKEQNLSDESLTQQTLINAMVDTPKLIERPIVVCGNRAAIGRPPENVLSIL